MSGFKGFLFSCIISHGIGGFEDICEDSSGESFEEQISGFSVSLSVSSLSSELFKISNVLGNVGPLHVTLFEGGSSLLLLIRVLELGFKLIEELGSDDGEVVVDLVKSIDPYSHVSDPSCDFISFDKGEGESNLLDW